MALSRRPQRAGCVALAARQRWLTQLDRASYTRCHTLLHPQRAHSRVLDLPLGSGGRRRWPMYHSHGVTHNMYMYQSHGVTPRAQSCRTRHPQRRLAPLTMYQSHGEIASCSQFGRSLRQRGRAGWRGWGAGDRALRGVGRLQAARRLCMLGPEGACPTTYGSQGVAGGANRAV